MIANAFIIAFIAGNAFVKAAPANTVPETITITPPTTTMTLVWPDGFLGLPGRTTTITSTLLGPDADRLSHETATPKETANTSLSVEEPVSTLPIPSNDSQFGGYFIPIEVSAHADFTSTANGAQVSPDPHSTGKAIDSRGPLPEKTIFITITKEPVKPSSAKPKATQSNWSKGEHCPYPYPGERCSPPKSSSKTTKTSSSNPTKTSGPKNACPYPGQDC